MAVFHSSMPRLRGRLVAVLVASLLLAACDRGPAALPAESLQIRINLLCTTCDDFLRCERRVDVEVDLGTDSPQIYRIYRLREKTFWAQIATIWDYLVQWLQRKTSDERPLTVYLNDGDARSMLDISGSARVDAAVGLISLPDSSIDMRNGEWRDLRGESQGRCTTLPRREGYAWVRALLGRELPTTATPTVSGGDAASEPAGSPR